MTKIFRLALLQLKVTANKPFNLANARSKVMEASKQGAQVAVLPECFNSPYGTGYFEEYAEVFDDQSMTLNALKAMAKDSRMVLVGGSIPERDNETGKLYNTCTVWSAQGELLGKHRKVNLVSIVQ